VWGGKPDGEFVRLNRFAHQGAQLIDFSPGERYLMSYSSVEPSNPRESMAILLNIFDTRSGKLLRKFEGPMEEYAVGSAAGPQGSLRWPFFKWAGGLDDMYFARLGKGKVRSPGRQSGAAVRAEAAGRRPRAAQAKGAAAPGSSGPPEGRPSGPQALRP
jgi:uncharacterized protein with WD repeat